jgi:hypothetical protein
VVINAENWRESLENGWRFALNLSGDAEADALAVAALQQERGNTSVAVGFAFCPASLKPKPVGFGIYLKDVEEALAELEEDVLNYECGHMLVDSTTGEHELPA